MPFSEVTVLFIINMKLSWGIPRENFDRHSNLIYLVLKPLKFQNFWCNFDRPIFSMHFKYAEYACKLQTFFP